MRKNEGNIQELRAPLDTNNGTSLSGLQYVPGKVRRRWAIWVTVVHPGTGTKSHKTRQAWVLEGLHLPFPSCHNTNSL